MLSKILHFYFKHLYSFFSSTSKGGGSCPPIATPSCAPVMLWTNKFKLILKYWKKHKLAGYLTNDIQMSLKKDAHESLIATSFSQFVKYFNFNLIIILTIQLIQFYSQLKLSAMVLHFSSNLVFSSD